MMTAVFAACAILLAVGGGLSIVRANRGPTMLDRAVALDVFAAVLVGAIAIEAAWSRRTETIPILVVLSLVGFVSSVTMARFAAVEPPHGDAQHVTASTGHPAIDPDPEPDQPPQESP